MTQFEILCWIGTNTAQPALYSWRHGQL